MALLNSSSCSIVRGDSVSWRDHCFAGGSAQLINLKAGTIAGLGAALYLQLHGAPQACCCLPFHTNADGKCTRLQVTQRHNSPGRMRIRRRRSVKLRTQGQQLETDALNSRWRSCRRWPAFASALALSSGTFRPCGRQQPPLRQATKFARHGHSSRSTGSPLSAAGEMVLAAR